MEVHNISLNHLIKLHIGRQGLRICKRYERSMVKCARYREHLTFNKRCFYSEVIPKPLRVKPLVNHPDSHKAAKICGLTFVKSRIKLCKSKLNYLDKLVNTNYKEIKRILPRSIVMELNDRIEKLCIKNKYQCRARQIKKFNKLKQNVSDIKFKFRYNYQPNNLSNNDNSNWIVNLSHRSFDQAEHSVLKLDPRFQIVPRNINKEQIIANIESKLTHLINDPVKISNIRNNLVQILKNCKPLRCNLLPFQLSALKRLKSYQDIIITNSDKGNLTVILNKQDYINKINETLSNEDIYEKYNRDNCQTIANNLIRLLSEYKNNKLIPIDIYRKFYPGNYNIPYIYALIETHKPNNHA